MLREEALLAARPFSGSCDDIRNAYDGISRELAVVVACVAGFPKGLARAYMAFHQGLTIHSGLAQGLGAPPSQALVHSSGLPLEQCPPGTSPSPLVGQAEGLTGRP